MAELSRRAQRRHRHLRNGGVEEERVERSGEIRKRGRTEREVAGSRVKEEAERVGGAETAGEPRFGDGYGEGFGVGAGRGTESGSSGLEGGSLREKDYRGLSGTRIGAPVGPDGLKEDTSQDKRGDPKPGETD